MPGSVSPASTEEARRFLIVDGHAYAYRAFYAIRSLNAPSGEPTNAIYGFLKMLGRMKELVPSSYLAVVWDGGLASERTTLLPSYKAQRPPMPDSLDVQITGIKQYLDASGVRSLEHEGIEADDWIATLAHSSARAAVPAVIASSDKDFMQLVSPVISLLNPGDRSESLWGDERVRQKAGVGPEAIVDWLSLIGDTVDNIAGVPGVGPKTAAELLNRFGSVDQIYARLDEVTSDRLRNALRDAEADVRRNQTLIRLRRDLPLEPSWEGCAVTAPSLDRLRLLYQKWGFRSLLEALGPSEERQAVLL